MRSVGRTSSLTVALALACVVGGGCRAETKPADTGQAPAPAAAVPPPAAATSGVQASEVVPFTPAPPAYLGELPPFPVIPSPAARPPEVIRAVYTFAAQHPEVLHYVPCFCGCQHSGHSDNDDCFIKSRDSKGRPRWEEHGMT